MYDDKNKFKAEQAVTALLECFGVDVNREGLQETPARVVRMLKKVWAFEGVSNKEIAEMYGKTFPANNPTNLVLVKDIECFSYCEHHLALIYDMKISIAYYPTRGRVLGLSKIARIADSCCKRLQLQERIGEDIVEAMKYAVSDDVLVRIEASHSCMTARGIEKPGAKTVTISVGGLFKDTALVNMVLKQN